jgi:competence protein ComEC
VVSHQDSDHSGGAVSLLETVPIGEFWSSLPAHHPLLSAGSPESRRHTCVAGQRWHWDGVDFEMLHPTLEAYDKPKLKSNDLSCVLRVAGPAGSVLLTGDIEARSEAELLARDASVLRADLLVVPHHGSKTSSTPPFVAAVAPRIAAFTPGYRNRFGHPRKEVLARYVAAGSERLRTDLDGALTFDFAPGSLLLPRLERKVDRRYWRELPDPAAAPLE